MMLGFGDDVEHGWGDEQQTQRAADWLHVAPGQAKEVLVLSPTPARYTGHWNQMLRRFERCTQPRCISCSKGIAGQRRYVLAVLDLTGLQWLWEFGDVQAGGVRALLHAGGELRGLSLVLMRPPGRGGNLPLAVNQGDPWDGEGLFALGSLPEPVDVDALLFGVWSRQALRQGKETLTLPAPHGRDGKASSTDPYRQSEKKPLDFAAEYQAKHGRPPRGMSR